MPYASTMFWKPRVNLLTRWKVGGASVISDIRFRIDGTVLPDSS